MRLAISAIVMGVALESCGSKVPPEEPTPAMPVKSEAPEPEPVKVAEPEPPAEPEEPAPVTVELAGLAPKDAAAKLQALTEGTDTATGLRALPVAAELTIEIFADACDGKRSSCTRKEKLDPAKFVAWVEEVVVDPPGWATGAVDRCAKGCCTMQSVAKAAAKEDLSPPHGMFQLDKICFVLDAGKTTSVNALYFTEL